MLSTLSNCVSQIPFKALNECFFAVYSFVPIPTTATPFFFLLLLSFTFFFKRSYMIIGNIFLCSLPHSFTKKK